LPERLYGYAAGFYGLRASGFRFLRPDFTVLQTCFTVRREAAGEERGLPLKVEYDIPLARNIRRIGHLDIPGGGQIVLAGDHAFVGHMRPPHGTSIIDVSDPRNPRISAKIDLPDDTSHTHKVRVVGNLMITNVEQNDRHFFRKGDRLPALREKLGADAGDDELAAEIGVRASDIPRLDAAREHGYRDGGFKIYDISELYRPREIACQRTGGVGVHRFDADERYAYISTEMDGYVGNILVIYDIANPTRPVEVSRWHMEGQHIAAGEAPTWPGQSVRLHHALRVGDELWAAVWQAGLRVIDASDITAPRTIGAFNYHPPVPEPTHTVMPFERPIDGRRYALAIDEEHDHTPGRLHGFMTVLDVTDLGAIRPVSVFTVSELDSPWSRIPGARFGAHQYREKLDSTLVYATWFAGGLRIVDVADPTLPTEIAHYIPEPVADAPAPASNDVDLDHRGLIYVIDRVRGLDILEHTGT
jgi:hypothetical protein